MRRVRVAVAAGAVVAAAVVAGTAAATRGINSKVQQPG